MATTGDVGSSSWASSQRRRAPVHTATTTSLNVVPAARLTAARRRSAGGPGRTGGGGVSGALNDNRGARPVGCSSMTSPARLVGSSRAMAVEPRRAVGHLDHRLAQPRPLLPGRAQRLARRGGRGTRRPSAAGRAAARPAGPARRAVRGRRRCRRRRVRRRRRPARRRRRCRAAPSSARRRSCRRSPPRGPWRTGRRGRPSRPSMTHSSHSGRDRSSGTAWAWPTKRASAASPPSGGIAVWRTWYSRSNARSVAHDGRPRPSGTSATTRRADGTAGRRAATASRDHVVGQRTVASRPEDHQRAEVAAARWAAPSPGRRRPSGSCGHQRHSVPGGHRAGRARRIQPEGSNGR